MPQNYCTPISNNHEREGSLVCKDRLVNSWQIPSRYCFHYEHSEGQLCLAGLLLQLGFQVTNYQTIPGCNF